MFLIERYIFFLANSIYLGERQLHIIIGIHAHAGRIAVKVNFPKHSPGSRFKKVARSGEICTIGYLQIFPINCCTYTCHISRQPDFQVLHSLCGRTSYCKIWSLEAARLGVIMLVSLCNLTGISVAVLPMCLSIFRTFGKFYTRISRLWGFTRSCDKTSVRLVNRGPACTSFHGINSWSLVKRGPCCKTRDSFHDWLSICKSWIFDIQVRSWVIRCVW